MYINNIIDIMSIINIIYAIIGYTLNVSKSNAL